MFIKNKKAQVSDTITWIVATLIIVVVLSISVFFTKNLSTEKELSLNDKEKDFLATKSVTGFLRENVDLLEEKKYQNLGEGVEKVFDNVLGASFRSSWDFELLEGNENKIEIFHKLPAPGSSPVVEAFETNMFFGETELKYWKKCKSVCT